MSDSGQSVLLATAGYDHTIRFWEAPTGVCYKTLQHPDSQVNQLQITADRQRIAAAGNPSLRLFEINSGPPSALTTYDGHTSNVTAVGFEADGKWMYTASEDGTLKLWDLRAAGCQREYESGSPINSVALHPNQVEIVSGDRDGDSRGTGARPDPPLPVTPSRLPAGNIRVWDLAQNACSAELVPDGDKSIQSLSIARDASTLAAANVRGSVFLWRLGPAPGCGESRASADLEQCGSSAEPAEPTEPAEAREARAPSAADGAEPRHAEVGGAVPSRLRIEPLQKLQVRPTRGPARALRLAPPPARRRPRPRAAPQAHASYVIRCIISPDCRRLATTSADHTTKVWDMANNFSCEETLSGHQRWVWDAVFSADSAYLVTASSDQTARLWDLADGVTLQHYTGHHKAVTSIALHDGPV